MSGAAALLSELRSQGKTIAVVGSNLRIVPKVTDTALIDRLRAHKAELIELLKGSVSQYTLDYKAEIPAASTVEALAHDLIKLCTVYGLRLACDAGRHLSRRDRWRLVRGDGCDRGGWIFSCRLICKQLLLPM